MWPQRKTNGKEEKGFLARRVASAVAQMWEGVWIASTEWRAQWRAHRGERKGVVRGQMVQGGLAIWYPLPLITVIVSEMAM